MLSLQRELSNAARATTYQAVRYTAEIMQIDDTTRQLKHKSRKSVIHSSSKNGFDSFLEST